MLVQLHVRGLAGANAVQIELVDRGGELVAGLRRDFRETFARDCGSRRP